jgi:hypothetical protein
MSGGGGGGSTAGGVVGQVILDTSQVQPAVAQLQSSLNTVDVSMGKLNKSAAASAGGMANFGSRMMVVASFADDMQYGLRAVVNQIPQVTMAFGMGAGLAGAISIAAVAVNQLVNHWDDLVSVFTTRGPETAAEEMQRLAEKTSKTADEQERLNTLKEREQQIEAQRARRPEAEQAAGRAAGGAIQEAPYDQLTADVRGRFLIEEQGKIAGKVEERTAREVGPERGGWARRQIRQRRIEAIRREAIEEAREIANTRAETLVQQAEHGVGPEGELARNELRRMAGANPNLPGLSRFNQGISAPGGTVFVGPAAPPLEERRRAMADLQNQREALRPVEEDSEANADRYFAHQRNLEKAYREGEEEAQAEKDRAAALDVGEAARIEAGDEAGAGQELVAERNMQINDDFGNYLDKVREFQQPYKVGQSISADQYEASHRAIAGESPEVKELKEIKNYEKQLAQYLTNFKPIGVVRRGGGGGR